jgi:DNA-directed RNA polymerase subunit RPC12/RpoP
MTKCPACDHDVRTPFFLNFNGWSRLACPHCKARLDLKPRPIAIVAFPILVLALWLKRFGHNFAVTADLLIVLAPIAMVSLLVVRPRVRLRT